MHRERTGTFILWAARRVLVFVKKQHSGELEGLAVTLRAGPGVRGQDGRPHTLGLGKSAELLLQGLLGGLHILRSKSADLRQGGRC